jgi:hypothetical protein
VLAALAAGTRIRHRRGLLAPYSLPQPCAASFILKALIPSASTAVAAGQRHSPAPSVQLALAAYLAARRLLPNTFNGRSGAACAFILL